MPGTEPALATFSSASANILFQMYVLIQGSPKLPLKKP